MFTPARRRSIKHAITAPLIAVTALSLLAISLAPAAHAGQLSQRLALRSSSAEGPPGSAEIPSAVDELPAVPEPGPVAPTLEVSPSLPSATGALWTFTFPAPTHIDMGESLDISLPAGASTSPLTAAQVWTPSAGSYPAKFTAGGSEVAIESPLGVAAGTTITIALDGVSNPKNSGEASVSYAGASQQFAANLQDTVADSTPDAHNASSTVSTTATGAQAVYDVTFTPAEGELSAKPKLVAQLPTATDLSEVNRASVTTGGRTLASSFGITKSGSTLTFESPLALTAGQPVTLTIPRAVNPQDIGTGVVMIGTDRMTDLIPAGLVDVTPAQAVTDLTAKTSTSVAGATRVTYTLRMQVSSTGALATDWGTVSILAPEGTSFADVGSVAYTNLTTGVSRSSSFNQTKKANAFTQALPLAVSAGDELQMTIPSVINPAEAGEFNLLAWTSSDPHRVEAPVAYTSANAVDDLAVSRSTDVAGATDVAYTITARASTTGALEPDTGLISLRLPEGVDLTRAGSLSNATVTNESGTNTPRSAWVRGTKGNETTLSLGTERIKPGDRFRINFSGIANPRTAGTLTLSTSSDTTPVRSQDLPVSSAGSLVDLRMDVSKVTPGLLEGTYTLHASTSPTGALISKQFIYLTVPGLTKSLRVGASQKATLSFNQNGKDVTQNADITALSTDGLLSVRLSGTLPADTDFSLTIAGYAPPTGPTSLEVSARTSTDTDPVTTPAVFTVPAGLRVLSGPYAFTLDGKDNTPAGIQVCPETGACREGQFSKSTYAGLATNAAATVTAWQGRATDGKEYQSQITIPEKAGPLQHFDTALVFSPPMDNGIVVAGDGTDGTRLPYLKTEAFEVRMAPIAGCNSPVSQLSGDFGGLQFAKNSLFTVGSEGGYGFRGRLSQGPPGMARFSVTTDCANAQATLLGTSGPTSGGQESVLVIPNRFRQVQSVTFGGHPASFAHLFDIRETKYGNTYSVIAPPGTGTVSVAVTYTDGLREDFGTYKYEPVLPVLSVDGKGSLQDSDFRGGVEGGERVVLSTLPGMGSSVESVNFGGSRLGKSELIVDGDSVSFRVPPGLGHAAASINYTGLPNSAPVLVWTYLLDGVPTSWNELQAATTYLGGKYVDGVEKSEKLQVTAMSEWAAQASEALRGVAKAQGISNFEAFKTLVRDPKSIVSAVLGEGDNGKDLRRSLKTSVFSGIGKLLDYGADSAGLYVGLSQEEADVFTALDGILMVAGVGLDVVTIMGVGAVGAAAPYLVAAAILLIGVKMILADLGRGDDSVIRTAWNSRGLSVLRTLLMVFAFSAMPWCLSFAQLKITGPFCIDWRIWNQTPVVPGIPDPDDGEDITPVSRTRAGATAGLGFAIPDAAALGTA